MAIGPLALLGIALSHLEAGPHWAGRAATLRIYTGLKWLPLHEVNAPASPGVKRIVVVGSSNLAGWGTDWRWMARQRMDPWGRTSFSCELERELRARGLDARVINLAVNGARLRSQLFLHLYALERHPDLVVFAISSWMFIRDGDFRDPKNMLSMNDGLRQLLDRDTGGSPLDGAPAIRAYLAQQPSSRMSRGLGRPTRMEALAGVAARKVRGAYERIGLPPSCSMPPPDDLLAAAQKTVGEVPSPRVPSPVLDEMVGLFPNVAALLHSSAQQAKVRLVGLVVPTASPAVNAFLGDRLHEMQAMRMTCVDLRGLPMRPGVETYDGHHFTATGHRTFAAAFADEIVRGGLLP
jgi:hypothetical protein